MCYLVLVIVGVGAEATVAATVAASVAAALARATVMVDRPALVVLLHPRLGQARQVAVDGLDVGWGALTLLEALDVGGTALVRPVGIHTRSERVAGHGGGGGCGVEVGLERGGHSGFGGGT